MINITTLKNGIRVVTEEIENAQTVSLGTWVGVGSRYEARSENGISHFLEHMAFKGTKTRSALEIAQEIENVGGYINAYTGKDMTGYYVHLLKENMPTGLGIISDIVQHATMDQKELDTEKGVILQELSMYKDRPDYVVAQNFDETAYADQPFGRDVGGDPEVIRTMTSDKMLEYMHRQYTSQRMIISASGAIKHDDFVTQCESLYNDVNTHAGQSCEKAIYTGGSSYVNRANEQVNLLVGFEGESYTSPDRWTAKILALILGGGMTSRLFQEIREKRGLVYTVRAMADSDADTGMFNIYAGTGEKEVGSLMPVLCDEILRLADTLNDEEIDRAKTQIKARLLMQSEDISSHADRNARLMLNYGRVISDEEILKTVMSIQKSDLSAYAKKLFAQKPTVAALGPIQNLMSYQDICTRLKG